MRYKKLTHLDRLDQDINIDLKNQTRESSVSEYTYVHIYLKLNILNLTIEILLT